MSSRSLEYLIFWLIWGAGVTAIFAAGIYAVVRAIKGLTIAVEGNYTNRREG